MTCIRQHIPLSLRISHQIMPHYSLLREYLHRILLSLSDASPFLHQEHLAEAPFPQQLYGLKALHIDLLRHHCRTARVLSIHQYVLLLRRTLGHTYLHRGVILLLQHVRTARGL